MDEFDLEIGDFPLEVTFDAATGKVLDTEHVMEQIYALLTQFDVAIMTAGRLFRILEDVGPEILPNVTAEQWRLLATSAVAASLRDARSKQGET